MSSATEKVLVNLICNKAKTFIEMHLELASYPET
jgi:hypothetical protein